MKYLVTLLLVLSFGFVGFANEEEDEAVDKKPASTYESDLEIPYEPYIETSEVEPFDDTDEEDPE